MSGAVLLLGGSGLLGGAFRRALAGRDLHVASRDEIAISRLVDGSSVLHRQSFAQVINCIAHTRVEAAEDLVEDSFRTNALLPGLIAAACRETGARMVHFSSTGAYGSGQDAPWDDYADPVPATVHHRSKIAGEHEIRAQLPGALILRTGWLYGPPPGDRNDFVAMIAGQAAEAARKGESLLSDGAQRGNPTLTDDVAAQTLTLIGAGLGGTYNCVARGVARRLDYVTAIVAALGLGVPVEQAPPGHFTRRAPVSPNEGAVNLKLAQLGLDAMPDWREALTAHIRIRNLARDLKGPANA